jgi:hypothetical protein
MTDDRDHALRRVQRQLEQLYQLEPAPDVTEFVRTGAADSRETLLVRQLDDEIEVALVLPEGSIDHSRDPSSIDRRLQLIEGVSHFVYIAERARIGLPTTQLELELQAEVDKFVLLAADSELEPRRVRSLHWRLYERVEYLHAPHTEAGKRYRMANDLAARFMARLIERAEPIATLHALRRFYRSGQTDKIRLAQAA